MKCGLYVLLFIHSISHLGLKDLTKFLYGRFVFKKRELPYNDKYVTRLLCPSPGCLRETLVTKMLPGLAGFGNKLSSFQSQETRENSTSSNFR